MEFTVQERICLYSALQMFHDNCQDELHEKENVPGEEKAAEDDRHMIALVRSIDKKLDLRLSLPEA